MTILQFPGREISTDERRRPESIEDGFGPGPGWRNARNHDPVKPVNRRISPSRAIATSIAIPFFFVGLLIGGFGWSFLMIGALINHMGEE